MQKETYVIVKRNCGGDEDGRDTILVPIDKYKKHQQRKQEVRRIKANLLLSAQKLSSSAPTIVAG